MQLKTLCSGVEYLVPSLAEHEEVTYSCASVFIRFLSKHRTKLELHLNYTLRTALLITPKWDGTLPPYPKKRKKALSWKGCHAVLDKLPTRRTTVSQGFQWYHNPWVNKKKPMKTLSEMKRRKTKSEKSRTHGRRPLVSPIIVTVLYLFNCLFVIIELNFS